MYKRILIKLSGEALGINGTLFDFQQIDRVANVIARLRETCPQIALILGAGNIWRGRQGPAARMNAATADHMGMLATAINALAMEDALERAGVPARTMSAVDISRFAELYSPKRAIEHLEQGRVVIFACGLGSPLFSTDTPAAVRAVEIGADAIFLAKNVDGVYDSDPRTNASAKLLPDLTYAEAIARGLRVMDTAALAVCMENALPQIRVFGLSEPENILRVAAGEAIGTVVHP